MATSSRRRSSTSAPRTARPGEREAESKARHNRIAAEKRARSSSTSDTKDAKASKTSHESGVDLDSGIFSISERGIEPRRDDQTERQHRANPDKEGDTSVRHAEPPTGKQAREGAGGYPTGEYDVVQPAKAGPATDKSPALASLEAHFGDYDIDRKVKEQRKNSRLNETAQLHAIEAIPIGSVIEHEGQDRWRVRTAVAGVNRFGHGTTAAEAIENFILGERPKLAEGQKAELEKKVGQPGSDDDSSGAAAASAADVEGRKRGVEADNPGAKEVLEATEGQTERRAKESASKSTSKSSSKRRSSGSSKAKRSGKKRSR